MTEVNNEQNTQGNREHKSSLFNLAFEKKAGRYFVDSEKRGNVYGIVNV